MCVCMCMQAEWEKLFKKVSLNMVMVKKSFYGSVIFLGRRKASEKQPIALSVDSTDYAWVDTLKVSLVCLSVSVYKVFS